MRNDHLPGTLAGGKGFALRTCSKARAMAGLSSALDAWY